MRDRDSGLLAQIEQDVVSDGPLADALRKCVLLGGRAGSVRLREWATRELKGYSSDEDVPDYRTVAAPIMADAVTGSSIVRGQRLSVRDLPDFARDRIEETFTFRNGIGELEAMVERASLDAGLKLSLPMAADLGRLMDQESDNPFQHINALYWSISSVALKGIVDQVKTTLTELVAEMRAGMPLDQETPSTELADQAVNIAVHGSKSRVTVTTAQATGGSRSSASPGPDPGSPFWTKSRKIGAFAAGLASVLGLGFAIAQAQGWF